MIAFGLASGLLTTGGVVGGIAIVLHGANLVASGFAVPAYVVAALVSVTLVLITVLFVVDRYYSVVHWGAVSRALVLEQMLQFNVTSSILGSAQSQTWSNWVVVLQYGSFIVISVILGVAVMGGKAIPSLSFAAADLMWIVAILSLTSIVVLQRIVVSRWLNLTPSPV